LKEQYQRQQTLFDILFLRNMSTTTLAGSHTVAADGLPDASLI